jgi:hypothetical protein
MKIIRFTILLLSLLILGCSNPSNTPDFISNTSGKYLFNPDEAIEVYFIENELFLKWNGADNIKPLKTDAATF